MNFRDEKKTSSWEFTRWLVQRNPCEKYVRKRQNWIIFLNPNFRGENHRKIALSWWSPRSPGSMLISEASRHLRVDSILTHLAFDLLGVRAAWFQRAKGSNDGQFQGEERRFPQISCLKGQGFKKMYGYLWSFRVCLCLFFKVGSWCRATLLPRKDAESAWNDWNNNSLQVYR